MEGSQKAPRANAEPPDLSQPTEILKWLLSVEVQRLDVAKRIEDERDIVFPETSVIIHDILKLTKEIESRECANEEPDKKTQTQDDGWPEIDI